jgi:hypothetical protein
MLTVSQAFTTALSNVNRIWKTKVTVTRNYTGAVPLDISDRVVSCTIDYDWEKRNAQASLELDNFDFSLSPLNQSSATNYVGAVFDPLLDSNHTIEIYEGLVTTNGVEYLKKFTGVLGDEIDIDTYPGTVQLTARDMSKLLQDTYIYQSKTYSVGSGNALPIAENVIKDLILTFLPSGNIVVSVDSPTNYVVGKPDSPYTAKDINLWDAIQQISDAFNFSVMFDEGGVLRLKAIVRDLSTVPPVYSFNEALMVSDRASTSDSDVRNHVMLRVQGLDIIEKTNDDSIAKYGRRYFEITRSMANIIKTAEDGHRLVDSILQDLSYVTPVNKVELPLFPIIQAGDVVSVVNTRIGTDAATYRYRVTSVRDTLSADKKRTSLSLQGYNIFNPSTVPAPKAPTLLSGSTISRSIQNYPNSGWSGNTRSTYYPLVVWTPPVQDISGNAIASNFGGYTIYRKGPGDTGYYPTASIKSYNQATGTYVNYWYDYTAIPGVNQYKMVAINKTGKVSAESSVLNITKPSDTII